MKNDIPAMLVVFIIIILYLTVLSHFKVGIK